MAATAKNTPTTPDAGQPEAAAANCTPSELAALAQGIARLEARLEQMALAGRRYLTRDEAATYLNVSTFSLWQLEKKKAIRRILIGAKVLYDREDVDAYMASQKA